MTGFESLSFLADENIHPLLILWFQQNGYHIIAIKDVGLTGADDNAILDYAEEHKLTVLTHDSDFGQIVFTGRDLKTGIVFIRPGHIGAEFHEKTILAVLEANLNLSVPFILVAEKMKDTIKLRLRQL